VKWVEGGGSKKKSGRLRFDMNKNMRRSRGGKEGLLGGWGREDVEGDMNRKHDMG